ncbi:hypothetical protein [Bacillus sp. B15-48]|uniref:hypothetical protein n=1 Tax=Bacillus sp. B15-48 TaxID=1548601 RepID=UPI001940056B|nr:hypothetical protein [Bacillus sp. B15-48]MBM4762693.1 hypothetical protein [Bacillus sp. B15-48]
MDRFSKTFLKIPHDTGYWLVRADGGKYYDDFLLNNFIAVSDNEITLDMINNLDEDSIAGKTIEHYKSLYKEKHKMWTPQQIAQAAGRTHKFVDGMKEGDLVLVPAKRSSNFLIGVVISDVYEISENELSLKLEVHYSINPYLKRRKVQWLKEVKREEISEKLYWILSAHQTIFDLSEEKDKINQLLAPIYIQDNICHGTIKLSKKEGLNSNEWFDLYSIIKTQSDSTDDEIIIKSNVQSPGVIELLSNNAGLVITTTILLSGLFGGEIKVFGIKTKGIIPYFQEYKKGQLAIKKTEKEIELMEEERKSKQLENQKNQLEIERDVDNLKTKKLENEIERIRLQLQISSFDAGKIIEDQKQMDSAGDLHEDKP